MPKKKLISFALITMYLKKLSSKTTATTTTTMSITRDDLKDAVFLIRAKLVTADN
jgi:hypothetical protein